MVDSPCKDASAGFFVSFGPSFLLDFAVAAGRGCPKSSATKPALPSLEYPVTLRSLQSAFSTGIVDLFSNAGSRSTGVVDAMRRSSSR